MRKKNSSHLQSYKEYMTIHNYSQSTIKSYLLGLRQFLEFRTEHNIIDRIDQEQARQFILFKYDKGAKWQTINNVYSALRKYFRDVLYADWCIRKIKRPRRERVLPVLINTEEVVRIVEHCNLYKYQVFIMLLYSTGLRLSECLHIKIEHIDGVRKELLVKKGKGSKDRYVHLPESILTLLREYYIRESPEEYLFNGKKKGELIGASSAQRAIRNAVRASKILKKVSTHTFRNCYATHHLENATNIVYLQQQMGHKHLKTTARYIRLSKTYHQKVKHPVDQMKINYLNKSRR